MPPRPTQATPDPAPPPGEAPDLPLQVSGSPEPRPRVPRRRWRWLLALPLVPALLLAGAVIGMYYQPPGLRLVFARTGLVPGAGAEAPIALPPEIDLPRDVVQTIAPTDVIGLARLIPRGDIITVAPPYGAGDARIAAILVAEGDEVAADQLLARLDNAAQLEAAVLAAEAELAVREAALAQTEATVRASRDEAQAALEQAEVAAAEAASDYARTRSLADRGVATPATLDAARAAERQAALAVSKARATLERFAPRNGGRPLDVIVAERSLDAARAELERARRDIVRAEVRAPVAGTILSIDARPGERPAAGGMLQMGDTARMMAEAEVYQDRIAQVKPGQPVELVATAVGETFRGTVSSIGLIVGRQGLLPDDIAANTDARVVSVGITLSDESIPVARRYTNLEVVARIDTRPPATDPPDAP